jgi:hypothetical protein
MLNNRQGVVDECGSISVGHYGTVSIGSDYTCLTVIISGTGIRNATRAIVSNLLGNSEIDGKEYATTYDEKREQDAENPRGMAYKLSFSSRSVPRQGFRSIRRQISSYTAKVGSRVGTTMRKTVTYDE